MLNSTATLENWEFLRRFNLNIIYNPAILLLGKYPREMKTYIYINICMLMSIAASFKNASLKKTIQMSISL